MALNVIPEKMYTVAEVNMQIRRSVDDYRRARRRELCYALVMIIPLMIGIRLMVDSIIKNPRTDIAVAISPYITLFTFGVGLTLWFGSIYLIFRRRG